MQSCAQKIAPILVVAALYFAAGKLGLSLAYINPSASAVWPPTGLALATLLLWGYRLWPGVLIGAFLVNFATPGHLADDIAIALGNTSEALLGAWFVNRFARGVKFFESAHDVFKFTFLAGVLSTSVSASVGVTSLSFGGEARWEDFPAIWFTWWLGDMMSNLIVAPLLVIWVRQPFVRLAPRRVLELLCLLVTLLLVNFLVLSAKGPPTWTGQFKYMAFLPILWASFRFGPCAAITSAFLTSGIALASTLRGTSSFVSFGVNESLLFLQIYLGALTLTGLAVAAVVLEREQAENALRNSEERERARAVELQAMMQAVPAVVWIAQDVDCRVITGNPASYAFLRLSPEVNASKSGIANETLNHFEVLHHGRVLRPEELPVQRAARGEEVRDFEEEVRFNDGTSRYLLGNATPLHDANGKVSGAIAAFVDITERKRAETALHAREAELGMIINGTPFMLTRCRRDLRYCLSAWLFPRWLADGRTNSWGNLSRKSWATMASTRFFRI